MQASERAERVDSRRAHGTFAPMSFAVARDLIALTKPRITLMVMLTTAVGMWTAPQTVHWSTLIAALLGIAGVVSSASTLNCWVERDLDALMARTANRPLPAKRLHPQAALILGSILALLSIPALTWYVNPLTAGIASAALVLYVTVYTPMKRFSPWALHVGAIPGAVPPLMGWTAVTNSIDAPALVLFGIMFLWQLPHFAAIALFRHEDYARAGMRVVSVAWSAQSVRVHALLAAIALCIVSLMMMPLGVSGLFYTIATGALGVLFIALCLRALPSLAQANGWSRRVFRYSLLYLPAVLAVLVVDIALQS